MPTRTNFKNNFRKSTESKDVANNPKIMITEKTISEERRNLLIDWITFYRRNVHRFIQHYFGIKLHPYQVLWIYWMGITDSFVSICSRAVGKSWIVAVFACAKAVLYPKSEIVIVSSTKEQAGLIVTEKISSLYDQYPNFAREISNITANANVMQVDFYNGSTIKVVASRDSSRGHRSTLTLFEEFRLLDIVVLDSVIRQFAYIRQAPYLLNKKYEHLGEEPKEIFISSAYHKGLWWFEETKKTIKAMLRGESAGFFCADYILAIRWHIKSKKQIQKDISKMDEITVLEEIYNIPFGESSNAYFRLKMFERSRKVKKAFYPQRILTFNPKKNPYAIQKTEGELRIVSCDTSQKSGARNDLSVSSCIRLLPTQKGYVRQLCYMKSVSGQNSITQSLHIKQLYYDFDADYIVLDVAAGGGGLPMYDQLGQITADAERGVEYPAMTIMEDPSIESSVYEELFKRTLGLNAIPNIYPISATAKLNSLIAVQMRDKLQKRLWEFLVDEITAEDFLIKSSHSKEFLSQEDPTAKSFFLAPYVQTSLMVNQFIDLSMSIVGGNLKLIESPGNQKDRYSSVSYGNYFAFLLDQHLIREDDDMDDFKYISELVQTT